MRFLGFIKREKHLLDPEEVLLDRKAEESAGIQLEKLEKPISPFLIKLMFFLSLSLALLVGGRSFALQFIEGANYRQRANNNRIRYSIINAPRGIIYDRFHHPLVLNSPSFSLEMIPLDLPPQDQKREEVINKVSLDFQIDKKEIENILAKKENRYSITPILLKANLTMAEVRHFETLSLKDSGFEVVADSSRYYPEGKKFAHLIGYVGKISAEDQVKYKNYPLSSMVGKDGLESYYETTLQGKAGKKLVEIDAHNNIQQSLGEVPPQKGKDLTTTIDQGLQIVLYDALQERMKELGIKGAAGIALNPQTGEVLALVSLPSFDPNVMTKGSPSSLINSYFHSSSHPLLNRVIGGVYPPGSVIKPLIALAALKEHIIDPDYKMHTNGKIIITSPYEPHQKYIFRDWQNNGIVDMRKAIAMSCNVYFWAIGGGWKNITGLGLARIRKYWKAFGFDKKLGIDLPGEINDILPSKAWLQRNRPSDPTWKQGDTYGISIGEGGLMLTPLQIAAYISTIANNGVLMKPHLQMAEKPQAVLKLDIPQRDLQIVQEGMREVITSGTAKSLSSLPFTLAGKSGSPKFIHNGKVGYHALFAAYAPFSNPQIVLLVLAENPPSGEVITLPVVKKVLSWYWENRLKSATATSTTVSSEVKK